MTNQHIPILVYHHVYPESSDELQQATFKTGAGIIGESDFRRQMQYIVDEGWTVVATTQIIDWLKGGHNLPAKALAIHFDNGWLDTITVAMPILRKWGMTSICFPITDGVEATTHGKTIGVRTLTEGVVKKPFMNWDQVTQLLDGGWEIGAHTATHCKVADKHAESGDQGVLWEAQTSNALFQKHLGFVPKHFAYPSGSCNAKTDELLARYYQSLRLWHFEWPIHWTLTNRHTSLQAIDCQNIDLRVAFDDFCQIFKTSSSLSIDELNVQAR